MPDIILVASATDPSQLDMVGEVMQLLSQHAWIPLAALVINFLVRQLKSDAPLPINVPAKWRPFAAVILGIVSGVLQAIITGTKPGQAIVGGLISAMMAVFTNEAVVSSLLNSKEFMPKVPWFKSSAKPSSIKPPPGPGAAGSALILIVVGFFLVGCGGNFEEVRNAHIEAVRIGTAPPVRDRNHCDSLSGDHKLFITSAFINGMVSTGTGIGAGAVQGNDATTTAWREGLGITAGITAALAVTSTLLANNSAQNWAADCGGETPIPAPVPIQKAGGAL